MVAMATYSSHRLIMGKEEIDHFPFSLWIFVIFTEMVIQCSSTFNTTFV